MTFHRTILGNKHWSQVSIRARSKNVVNKLILIIGPKGLYSTITVTLAWLKFRGLGGIYDQKQKWDTKIYFGRSRVRIYFWNIRVI